MCLKMFPKGYNRGTVSYVERKRVPEGWGIMTLLFNVIKMLCLLLITHFVMNVSKIFPT